MTPEALRDAESAYRAAYDEAEVARSARNSLVREALEAGWTHAQIAEATGMSRARVGQIALASR